MKQVLGMFIVSFFMLTGANANAAWHLVNGQYYWFSPACDVLTKGGGSADAKQNTRITCSGENATYVTFCVNPDGRIVGNGTPSQAQDSVVVTESLTGATDVGNGKQVSTLELPLEFDEGDVVAIEAALGEDICKQNNFTPFAALLASFRSSATLDECSGDVVDGVCDGTWVTQSVKTYNCDIPGASEITTYPPAEDVYPPATGTELDCLEI